MFVCFPQGSVLRLLLLLSVMGAFAVSGSEGWAGAPRDFEVEPDSELRIWITQEVGGVVQPPSIGQPPSVSALSGSVAAEKESEFWTLTNVNMAADDLTVSFLYPMADLSFVNSANLVGLEHDSILSLVASACSGCTDFAVDFGYTFGTRPPASQPIVDPLEFAMGLEPTPAGDVLRLSGVAADGFIAIFENTGLPPGTLPLWIELDMLLVEVPVEPTELFDIQPGSEIRIYETAVVGGEAQPPTLGQEPGATSVLTGVVEGNRDADFWSFSLVDLEAADTSITLSTGTVQVTDITLDMPFVEVPDSDGVLQTVSQLNGFQSGAVLFIDETACAGCTDFAAALAFTIGLVDPVEIALIQPLPLDVTTDSSGTALSGSFAKGVVLDPGIGIWIEGDIDLISAPEPSQGMLACVALVTLGLLSRSGHRRRARSTVG